MNNRQTEKSVRRGFTNATPDNLAEIKANCQSTSPTRRAAARTNYWRYATCALAFVLLVVSVFGIVGLTKQGAVTASAATPSGGPWKPPCRIRRTAGTDGTKEKWSTTYDM